MIKKTIKRLLALKPKKHSKECRSLVFVHIPKTAGSSFREALERSFYVYKDYRSNSAETSSVIKQYSYDNNDLFSLKKKTLNKRSVCIVGHIPILKYLGFVPIEHTVTFVRKPVEQLLSHYNHFVNEHGFTGDLAEFIQKPFNKNFQSKFIQGLPLGLVGHIGLTERYDESIEMINKQYDLNLGSKKYVTIQPI
jgi:hypothetical protein